MSSQLSTSISSECDNWELPGKAKFLWLTTDKNFPRQFSCLKRSAGSGLWPEGIKNPSRMSLCSSSSTSLSFPFLPEHFSPRVIRWSKNTWSLEKDGRIHRESQQGGQGTAVTLIGSLYQGEGAHSDHLEINTGIWFDEENRNLVKWCG